MEIRDDFGKPPSNSPCRGISGNSCHFGNMYNTLSQALIMGRELVTTKPMVLKMDKEVTKCFKRAGLMEFFQKFSSFNGSISIQVADSLVD